MNIIVKPYGSTLCSCRPDTTWERENKDFYSPECVKEVLWTPVVFARVAKAGKCIGRKFVERYYDGVGCGMLMYCKAESISACVDHTSILPMPLYSPVVMDEGKEFSVIRDGQAPVTMAAEGNAWRQTLEDAICSASQLTSLRIGDFVAVEQASPAPLASREEGEVAVKGTFCGNESFNFKIIF